MMQSIIYLNERKAACKIAGNDYNKMIQHPELKNDSMEQIIEWNGAKANVFQMMLYYLYYGCSGISYIIGKSWPVADHYREMFMNKCDVTISCESCDLESIELSFSGKRCTLCDIFTFLKGKQSKKEINEFGIIEV